MITNAAEALARFSRIGAMVSLLGATHALSLILNWFAIDYGGVSRIPIAGYTFIEPFAFSLAAGSAAGATSVLASTLRDISKLRLMTPLLASTSAALALLSPLYTFLVKLPGFRGLEYIPEVGLFASLFTAMAITGAAVLSLIAGLRTRVVRMEPVYWTQPLEETEASLDVFYPDLPGPEAEATPSASPQPPSESVEEGQGGQCMICGDALSGGSLDRCHVCGAYFHKDCINVWADLGNKCPSCGGDML